MFMHITAVETAILIRVWIPFRKKGMERKEQSRIMGCYTTTTLPQVGQVPLQGEGPLDTIPSIRYEDGNFMIPEGR